MERSTEVRQIPPGTTCVIAIYLNNIYLGTTFVYHAIAQTKRYYAV